MSRAAPIQTGESLLSGVKLLVVEDEELIAMDIEEMIAALGAEIVRSFSRVTDLRGCSSGLQHRGMLVGSNRIDFEKR